MGEAKTWIGGVLAVTALVGALERNTQAVNALADQERARAVLKQADLEDRRKELDRERERERRLLRAIAEKIGMPDE